MQEEGARGAALALEQLESINDYISAVQIGVTMTSIANWGPGRARARGDPEGSVRRHDSAPACPWRLG